MMIRTYSILLLVVFSLYTGLSAAAEPHRATRLGNPLTRFAEPLKTPEDLRRTLLKESLWEDVQKILRMSDYLGDMDDFRKAAATAEIEELSIPPGTLLPAMSTRHKGKADLLRNVLWAGKKPIDAYAFSFISGERRYRIVTPKACSNFWAEEQLPRPQATLALSCEAPAELPLSRSITVCNTLANTGELGEELAMLSLPIPSGAKLDTMTPEACSTDGAELIWKFENLAPGEKHTACATFTMSEPGQALFKSAAVGKRATNAATQCESRVFGIPAVLLEVIDLADPVLIGNDVTYVIRVLNQGTLPLSHLKVVARMEDSQHYLGGTGASEVAAGDGGLILPAEIALLKPKEEVEWRIVVKADKAGDVRFNVALEADQFSRPIMETEATFQY